MSKHIRIYLLLAVCSAVLTASSEAVETLWAYQAPAGHIAASPAMGDINDDGKMELVIATTGGSVIALDGQAQALWRIDPEGTFTVPPTVADVTGDAALEVLVLDNAGLLQCLEASTGLRLWEWQLPHRVDWGTTAIVAGDINHDGIVELITGDAEGTVVCLRGDGQLVWRYTGQHGFTRCPAVGDLDGDGFPEILIGGTKSPLVCLSHNGEERWRLEMDALGASPVIWDLDGDGTQEILVGIGQALGAVDKNGKVLWTYKMKEGDDLTTRGIDSSISVGDVDQDGVPEIFGIDLTGFMACLDPDGSLRWSAHLGKRARRSPSIADIDGDGVLEILVAGYSRQIHVFAPDGILKEKVPLGGESNTTATVVDLTGDGRPSVVCASEAGGMLAFQWPEAKANPGILWPEYRLNAARTASSAPEPAKQPMAITTFDPGAGYVGSNAFVIRVANPGEEEITLSMEIRQDDEIILANSVSSSENTIEQKLMYTISGKSPSKLSFSGQVSEAQQVMIQRCDTIYLEPFRQELADGEQNTRALRTLFPMLVDPTGIEGQILLFEQQLKTCRAAALLASALSERDAGTLQNRLGTLLEDSSSLLANVQAAAHVRDRCTGPLLACAANPWMPFIGMQEAVEGRTHPAELTVKAFPGETESAALNIFNFGSTAQTLRVEPGAITLVGADDSIPAKQVITLREAIGIPTQTHDLSADALPLMNQGNTLLVPAWSARQLWLSIDTTALKPGIWAGVVRLRSLQPESLELAATLTITVWDTPLPEEQPLNLCHWGYVHSSRLKDQPEAALLDQVSHGTNVFVGLFPPRAKYDEQGELISEIDFTAHDAYVRQYAPHGTILFCGYQGGLQGPGGFDSPAYRKANLVWMRAWVKHLADMGVGYDGFALYPVDEMGLHEGLVDRYLQAAKMAREADPNIRMYTDPAPGITVAELESTRDYADIWCPSTGFMFDPKLAEKFATMQSTGKSMWTYACSGHAKHLSPLGYYRGQSWLAWQHGLTGIGFWSYCTSADDPWYAAASRDEYLLIYQGNGVVPSKRWEAVRDGIEDYSMFAVLREAARAAAEAGKAPEAVREARELLDNRVTRIARHANTEAPGTDPGLQGFDGIRPIADQTWNDIQLIRADMARLLAVLTKE